MKEQFEMQRKMQQKQQQKIIAEYSAMQIKGSNNFNAKDKDIEFTKQDRKTYDKLIMLHSENIKPSPPLNG